MSHFDTATRAQALTLKAIGWSNKEIENLTGVTARALNMILDRAIALGYDPQNPRLQDSYVANAPKSGRPSKQESFKEEVLSKITESLP
ncbi:hypothetical protein B0T25DRAFT_550683 [Lasiosphaeria hispida]|uniref:Uncharacterized protein n=1 Tax=Lasiosphaeria hispida TaxID=260671 RepID=A0AAJ0HAC6_9PEZI|nr:hypothetical protein B0T25DRAFT_550683 [Lasiosphaeria hispida]